MPLTVLASTLNREESTIPNPKIQAILQEADVNGDRRIKYIIICFNWAQPDYCSEFNIQFNIHLIYIFFTEYYIF